MLKNIKIIEEVDTFADEVINYLLVNSIFNKKIIALTLNINRSDFLADNLKSLASLDAPVYYNKNRFLLDISTIAYFLTLSDVLNREIKNILIIGSGIGYLAAIVSAIAQNVVGIENEQSLIENAQHNMKSLSINNVSFINNNLKNIESNTKYDVILTEGAFAEVEQSWLVALQEAGVLVGCKRENNMCNVIRIKNINNNYIETVHKMVGIPYIPTLSGLNKFIF